MLLPIAGIVLDNANSVAGFMAAAIAVGGFLAHSQAVLGGASERELQRATAIGGVTTLLLGAGVFISDLVSG